MGDSAKGSPVAISNLAIIGGTGGTNGGAIVDFEPLTLTNLLITNGGVNERGGGLWAATAGKVKIVGCRILDNLGPLGGGGAWISAAGGVTVSKTVISGNGTAGDPGSEGGGAYFESLGPAGSINISDSQISKNTVGGRGGGLAVETDVNRKIVIKTSTISENSALFFGGIGLNGGALTISGTSFQGNSAASGGALGFSGLSTTSAITVTGSSFTGNVANDPTSFGGGAIVHFGAGPLKIAVSRFVGNSTAADGGALLVFSQSSVSLSGSHFSGNSASDGGALAFGSNLSGGGLNAKANAFDGNTAVDDGGAIFAKRPGTLKIVGGYFGSNVAGDNGGAFAAEGVGDTAATFLVQGTYFQGNSAASAGGAIYLTEEAGARIQNALFIDNFASEGGAFMMVASTGTAEISDSSFRGNTAFYGGAILQRTGGMVGALRVTFSAFLDNTAHINGGGIFIDTGSLATFSSLYITGNSAEIGGGIYNASTNTALALSSVFSNFAILGANVYDV